jgi:hypothetical protein
MDMRQDERAPALLVRRCGERWSWTVITPEGAVEAEGEAPDQDAAMSAAWETSRAGASPGAWDYPNIIVGRE